MSYQVEDSEKGVERTGLSLPDAIRAAVASGLDVYVHDDECGEKKLRRNCSCKPYLIKARP